MFLRFPDDFCNDFLKQNPMKDCIIYVKKEEHHLIGNVNIGLSHLVEVKIISPYAGLTLCASSLDQEEWNEDQQKENAERLLFDCFKISQLMENKKQLIKSDFHQFLHNLNTFNNHKSEDYARNRDELMRVFLRTHFSELCGNDSMQDDYGTQIFIFLNTYFALNGKCVELNLSSLMQNQPEPPPFASLENLLKEYLTKSEEQRIELLAQHIINNQKSKYSWFLSQEFLINN